MPTSDELRKNAENCELLSEAAESLPDRKRYRRMADAWRALAREQAWLDGEVAPCRIFDHERIEQ
ncbi:MAG: hypothetical protein KIT82_10030 [Bradyrhizobium sp.]|nr:hypothetical protein [Bradyrhizobium sp.]